MARESLNNGIEAAVFNYPARHISILAAIGTFGTDPVEPFHNRQINNMTASAANAAESFSWKRIRSLEEAGMVVRHPGRHGTEKVVRYERTQSSAWQIVHTASDVLGISFPDRPGISQEAVGQDKVEPSDLAVGALFGHPGHLKVLAAIANFGPDPEDPFHSRQIYMMTMTSKSEAFPWKRIMALEKAGMVQRLPGRQGKTIQYARLDVPAWRIIEKAIEVFGIKPPNGRSHKPN